MTTHKLRFALFGNIYQAKKSALVKKLLCCLESYGAEVFIDRSFYDYLTRELQLDINYKGLFEGNRFDADFAISMGGDGTFLQTAMRVGNKQIPIIGINMGRMGFLADVSGDDIEATIDSIYNENYRLEGRSVLEVELLGQGARCKGQEDTSASCKASSSQIHSSRPLPPHSSHYPYALNEVAVLKRDNSSMISIRVDINGEYLTTYQADGLLINTPTGSTGYALSVGGSIMSPNAAVLGITPVAAHSLNVRPITICDNAEIALTVNSRSHNFLVAIDGRSETCSEEMRLKIRKAPYTIQVLKRHNSSFFRTLREKLAWGTDIRN